MGSGKIQEKGGKDNFGYEDDGSSLSSSSTGHGYEAMEMKELRKRHVDLREDIVEKGQHTLMGKYVDKSEKARPAWDNQVQFLLACISYAVGLGNVWRFPYLAQTYGGGAFLIPYIIMLVIEGVPLFLIELAVGQRLRQGAIGAWTKFHPYLGGIGIGSMIVSATVGFYYNMIIAWCLWYLFNSFQYPLPYSYCPLNDNKTAYVTECAESSFTEYYWYRTTLEVSPSIGESDGLVWQMAICLILAWTIVWLSMIRGIESSGKVMYFTATFPYLVLTIFLIRGLTLPGASEGVDFLFTPDYEVLKNPKVWLDAATQIFFSLGLAFGGVIAFASYNPPRQNCQRDALIIALTNSFTSVYASLVIFSILGFRAYQQSTACKEENIDKLLDFYDYPEGGLITLDNYDDWYFNITNNLTDPLTPSIDKCDIQEILSDAQQGTGLAFIVFTEGIINMPGSPFWSVMFFLMLLSLGLGSMFGTIEGVVTPLFDLGIQRIPKPALTGLVCLVSFLVGLLFVGNSGNYWLTIFNDYAGTVPLLVIAFFEIITISWFYGLDNFNEDIRWMIGSPKSIGGKILFWYFRICWIFIAPAALLAVTVAFVISLIQNPPTYTQWIGDGSSVSDVPYPPYAMAVIFLLILLPSIPIPIAWLYQLIRYKVDDSLEMVGILEDKSWKSDDYFASLKFWKVEKDPPKNPVTPMHA